MNIYESRYDAIDFAALMKIKKQGITIMAPAENAIKVADFEVKQVRVTLDKEPKLGIVIPSKNRNTLLFACIDSILENTRYRNYKIYMADTGSDASVIEEFKQRYDKNPKVEMIKFNHYHFAGINNMVIKHMMDADTELVLCCNNDIQMLNDAISMMVDVYLKNLNTVGTVGARLHYENGTLQHLGMAITGNPSNPLAHNYGGEIFQRSDYSVDLGLVYGNTAAFMLISRNLFIDIGGYNESYEECFEDAELNLKLAALGRKNYLPLDAVCYHFESMSRREMRKESFITRNDFIRISQFLERNAAVLSQYL